MTGPAGSTRSEGERMALVETASRTAARIKRIDETLVVMGRQSALRLDLYVQDGDGEEAPPERFFAIGYGDTVNPDAMPHFPCVDEDRFRSAIGAFLTEERRQLMSEFDDILREIQGAV